MEIITSYRVKIRGWVEFRIVYDEDTKKPKRDAYNKVVKIPVIVPTKTSLIENTSQICQEMLCFCTDALNQSWDKLCGLSGQDRFNAAENLLHSTESNTAVYPEFDSRFYKFPSYMRRSVINDALGSVSSYRSNHDNWMEGGCEGNEPQLGVDKHYTPTFYNKDRSLFQDHPDWIQLRLKNDKKWSMETVIIDKHDAKYIQKMLSCRTLKSPSILKKKDGYYIQFVFSETVKMDDTYSPIADTTRIVAVDLGINNAATMCVMDAKGTVYARKVLKLAGEKDPVWHYLGCVKKAQQKGFTDKRMYRFARNANTRLSQVTADGILAFAEKHHAHCIVFEHLDVRGKKHGGRREKIHHWKCQEVQAIVERKAHQRGIRISHICAWGTSKLAFDGTGTVTRGEYFLHGKQYYNYSICVFPTGKIYHADLNAAYNIGARYFLREYHKQFNNVDVATPQRTLATLKDYVAKDQSPATA